MRALVLHGIADLRLEDVPTPEPGPGQVRIRVAYCGVCGSDIPRIFHKGTYAYPRICGHEFSGTVDAVGPGVQRVRPGCRVTVFPLVWCGACPACERGAYAQCRHYDYLGSRSDGGFAEFVIAPARNVLPLPDSVSFETAAMTEPAAVALHALRRAGGAAGAVVAIFGCGPIGLLAALHARAQGARRLLLFDIDARRLEIARRLGFRAAFDPRAVDPVQAGLDAGGATLALEAAGVPAATTAALAIARPGGRVVLVGNPAAPFTLSPETLSSLLRREIEVLGSWNSEYSLFRDDDDWHTTLDLLDRPEIFNVEPLVSHRLDYPEALPLLQAMAAGSAFTMKVLIGSPGSI